MNDRTSEFARNQSLEALLSSLNERLAPVGNRVADQHEMPGMPVILIVGCARSGTTLLTQWLASLDLFFTPSNFVSRFYSAPSVGIQIQDMITREELAHGRELDGQELASYDSRLGKTTGWLTPNEFWYFWRRFVFNDGERLQDGPRFAAELAAMEAEAGRPLAMKGMIANELIEDLDELLDKVVFIHLRRDPAHTAQSLLEARVAHRGDEKSWYSFQPPRFQGIGDLDPLEQVAFQVAETHRVVDGALNHLQPSRQIVLEYEQFCAEPRAFYGELRECLARQGFTQIPETCPNANPFDVRNERRLPKARWKALEKLLDKHTG